MGRGKLKLELIPKEKSRKKAFEKTTKVLMNKCREFSRREIDVCMIIIDDGDEHTYPKQTEEVDRIIQRYLTATKDKPPKKTTGLSEIFSNMAHQKKKVGSSELSKFYNEVDDELIIDQYCPNGDSNELVRFIDLLGEKIKQVELMIHAKKQQNHQQLDDDHNQHVNHDHGLSFDHQDPHYPIDPSLNNNVQFLSSPGYPNHDHGLSFDHQGPYCPIDPSLNNNVQLVSNPWYQNYASDEPLSSNYNYTGQYNKYDQGYYNNYYISATGPLVEDPTVDGMLEEDCWMFGNNNDDGDYPSSSSSMMMLRQHYPDQPQQKPLPPATIMPPPYQYPQSIPSQKPEIPFDHHHQQQTHGFDHNGRKGKKISDEYLYNELLLKNIKV
ncbi:hypothetical protein FNV43_RR01671 [Rhamnella rubrinervis]|uniref:MADS-box domain-containing protein n=1 Tax=Rhamnella rubrinervis TaxID=2594499 RepID=A0A8K0HRE0_9ROSA|nr:hypothetical protein FNV43_RR01671 [Rhamnella rubrinervis]